MNEMTMNLPPAGHNNPPPLDPEALEAAKAKVAQFADAAGAWLDLGKIETEEQSEKLTDFVNGARKVYKAVDEARIAAKRPHDEAGGAVQTAFKPLLDALERSVNRVKTMQTDFLKRQKALAEAELIKRQAAAASAKKAADEAALRAAARNDVVGEVEAEAEKAEAEKMEREASREVKVSAGSVTGAGRGMALRITRYAEITSINQLFLHYRERREVAELLIRLANTDIRAAGVDESLIPGIKILEKESAA